MKIMLKITYSIKRHKEVSMKTYLKREKISCMYERYSNLCECTLNSKKVNK